MLYFLIPIYNEEDNLPKLAEHFNLLASKQEIFFVFVDDCSSDSSVKMLGELFSPNSIHIITKGFNQGPGHSFNIGFNWILEIAKPTDLVVTLEADGTSDLNILPVMLDLARNYNFDLVLASVYAQGGGFEQTSLFRKLISFWANILLRLFFNIKILTLSSFYRVYHVELLRNIQSHNPSIIEQSGFVCMLELVIKSIRLDAKIIEVPMKLRSTERVGKSKMKIIKTSKEYLKFVLSQI